MLSVYYNHYVKSVCIPSFSGPYFSAYGLNTDQQNSEYGHFSRSETHEIFLWSTFSLRRDGMF